MQAATLQMAPRCDNAGWSPRVHNLPRFCDSFFNVVTQNLTQRNSLLLNLCNEMFIFQGLEAGDFQQGWRPSIAPPPPPEGPWVFMGVGGDWVMVRAVIHLLSSSQVAGCGGDSHLCDRRPPFTLSPMTPHICPRRLWLSLL